MFDHRASLNGTLDGPPAEALDEWTGLEREFSKIANGARIPFTGVRLG